MAAPTFVASYSPASDWSNGTSPKTVSVTVANSDLLIVVGATEDQGTTLATPTGGSLTYTLKKSGGASSYTEGYIWAATVSSGALTVTTPSLPGATDGVSYSQTETASGGSGTGYTWAVSAGALPSWASLASSTGVISGTPTGSGTASFTI